MKVMSNKKYKEVLKEVAKKAIKEYKDNNGFVYKLGVENRYGILLSICLKDNDIELYTEMLDIHKKYGKDDLNGGTFIVQKYLKGQEDNFDNCISQELYNITTMKRFTMDIIPQKMVDEMERY